MAAPSESSQTYDNLLNLNSESAKHSQWLVRVVAKRIEQYVYQAKKGQVNAQKLVCVMVGTDPSAYITGSAKLAPVRRRIARTGECAEARLHSCRMYMFC